MRGEQVRYGPARLLLCYAGPPLLARMFGGRRHWLEAHAVASFALAAGNVIVDYGPRRGIRALPDEMRLWPPRRLSRPGSSPARLVAAFVAALLLIDWLSARLGRVRNGPTAKLLNWTPLDVGWHPPEAV